MDASLGQDHRLHGLQLREEIGKTGGDHRIGHHHQKEAHAPGRRHEMQSTSSSLISDSIYVHLYVIIILRVI